jgi:CelD/BcsL family acetyltransferase involved in cellulose biosynthesis
MVNVAILTSEVEVEAIADAWRNLQAAAGRIPFTDYYFYEAWWHHIGKPEGKTPFIVTGRIDQRLVALLPLSVSISRGMRILQGMGVDAYYLWDCLLESPAYAEPLWHAVRQSRLYDFAAIKFSDPDSAGGKALAAFAQLCGKDAAPCLDVAWPDSKAWLASQSHNRRQTNGRHMRRLHDRGVRHHIWTDGPVPLDIVDTMVRQRIDWSIQKKLKDDLFSIPGVIDFFRRLVTDAGAQNHLYFSWMAAEERIIACALGFGHNGTFYIKTTSRDLERSDHAPGNLIMVEAIRWAVDKGFHKINFGLGVLDYKMHYARSNTEYEERVFSSTLKGHIAARLYVARRQAREWLIQHEDSSPVIKLAYAAVKAMRGFKKPATRQ